MFKADLQRRLKSIFGVEKTTFSAPDYSSPEQDCIFIEVNESPSRPHGKDRISAVVKGYIVMFSQSDKLTFGFFAKRIEQAAPSDRASFFFGREFTLPSKQADAVMIQNLNEKRVEFTFFYDSQYDPDRGELNELDLTLEMET